MFGDSQSNHPPSGDRPFSLCCNHKTTGFLSDETAEIPGVTQQATTAYLF